MFLSVVRYLPNTLTVIRILLAPYVVLSSSAGLVGKYTSLVLIFAFATDFLDGWIARRFNLTSPFGSRLDSIADSIFYWCIGGCLWMTQGATAGIRFSIIFLIALQILNWGFCLFKFRQITSYHSTIAKWTAPAIYAGVIALLSYHFEWLYWFAIAMGAVSNIEDMIITGILPQPATNIKNVQAALALNREVLAKELPS